MDIQKKPLEDATAQELRRFAEFSLGLEVDGTENRNVMLSKLAKGGFDVNREDATIVLFETPQPAPVMPGGGSVEIREVGKDADGNPITREYHYINLHGTTDEGGNRPVPVRVKGNTMLIPRGKRVAVPKEYVEALENAISLEYEMTDHGLQNPRPVPSYAFSRG